MKALWSQSLLADYLTKLTKLACLSNIDVYVCFIENSKVNDTKKAARKSSRNFVKTDVYLNCNLLSIVHSFFQWFSLSFSL